jgi:hypothetical protein
VRYTPAATLQLPYLRLHQFIYRHSGGLIGSRIMHILALDPFTLAVLKAHVEQLARERRELGPDYQDHRVLFCWEDGRPPHPDTITRRFKEARRSRGSARNRPARRPAQLRHARPSERSCSGCIIRRIR